MRSERQGSSNSISYCLCIIGDRKGAIIETKRACWTVYFATHLPHQPAVFAIQESVGVFDVVKFNEIFSWVSGFLPAERPPARLVWAAVRFCEEQGWWTFQRHGHFVNNHDTQETLQCAFSCGYKVFFWVQIDRCVKFSSRALRQVRVYGWPPPNNSCCRQG